MKRECEKAWETSETAAIKNKEISYDVAENKEEEKKDICKYVAPGMLDYNIPYMFYDFRIWKTLVMWDNKWT